MTDTEKSEILRSLLEVEASELQPENRADLLEAFTRYPDDPAVWQTAYNWVRTEGDDGQLGIAADVPALDLIDFAERIQAESDPLRRYALTALEAPNGRSWFATLETFSSVQIEQARLVVLQAIVKSLRDGRSFERGLDLGCGAGTSLNTMEKIADQVTGVDQVPELLELARQEAAEHTELVEASVTDLPFADDSFDVAASGGLMGGLDRDSSIKFFRELKRVLLPDGIYIDGMYAPSSTGEEAPELLRIFQSAKGVLADMIVDTTSGVLRRTDALNTPQRHQLLSDLGLVEVTRVVGRAIDEWPHEERTYIRIITAPTSSLVRQRQ